MKPKFAHKVDMSKPYVKADDTDVRATFARVSGEQRVCAARDEIDAKRYRALRKAAIDTNEKGFTSEAEIDQYVDEFVRETAEGEGKL